MHELLQAIVAQAGVQQIIDKAPQRRQIAKQDITTRKEKVNWTDARGSVVLLSLLVAVAAFLLSVCLNYFGQHSVYL